MYKSALLSLSVLYFAACSSSAPVNSAAELPGRWDCGNGVVVWFLPVGRYEWTVPAGSGVHFGEGAGNSGNLRTNPDGSYVLLGAWRLSGTTLEMDMLGDTDKYSLTFAGPTSLQMAGSDSYSCTKS